MNKPSISIVITTYNRSAALESLLGQFADQGSNFQIVVAIDGSTDETELMLQRQSAAFDLKWLNTNCSEYGLAVARNRGILAADGEAVVVLDDDSFPVPGFVDAHRASVTIGTITGGPRNPSDFASAPRMAWKMAELAKLPPLTPKTIPQMREEHPTAWLIENNVCLFRDDWIAMGLFSERLKMYGFIGQEFFARAAHLGMRYQFNPAAGIVHRGEMEGDNGLMRSQKRRETYYAKLLRPSLEKPVHFSAQVSWAAAMAANEEPQPFPAFGQQAAVMLPFRALKELRKSLTSSVKRGLLSIKKSANIRDTTRARRR